MTDILVRVDDLAHGGAGVGAILGNDEGRAGKRVFVQGTLPGEELRAELLTEKKRYAKARLKTLERASRDRAAPPCSLAERCGGCNWQHIRAERQAALKAEIARGQLRRCLSSIDAVHASAAGLGYRRRARLHVDRIEGEWSIGFYAPNSKEVVPVSKCAVLVPSLQAVLPWLPALGPWLKPGAQIHLLASGGKVLVGISGVCPRPSAREALERLRQEAPVELCGIEFRGYRQRLRIGAGTVALDDAPESLNVSPIRCGPFDFAQSQDEQNKTILEIVGRWVAPLRGRVLELYCGAGNLSRVLVGEGRRLEAWDEARAPVQALARMAEGEGISGLSAHHGKAEKALERALERRVDFDLLVVDPPRTGLGEKVVRGILKLAPKAMLYVSCDPATLARDLEALQAGGYRCTESNMVDMMPMTSEIEMVVMLEKID